MNYVSRTLVAVMALGMATVASATTLTFDGLFGQYGDGSPLGPNMSYSGSDLVYTEGGYQLTLHTFGGTPHIGDATYIEQTFNWHDSGDNLVGAYVTLSKVGGGAFSLSSFDYYNDFSGITVTAGAYAPLLLNGNGNSMPGFDNVTSVSFASNDYSDNQLDNIVLSAGGAVPEPASWALMLGGIGMVGAAARRRRVTVAYA